MKMKDLRKVACALAFAAVLFVASAASALEFSAEFTEKLGDDVRTGKIYVMEDRSRYEIKGSNMIEITRADLKVMWVVFPGKRVYVEEEFWGYPIGSSLANGGEVKSSGNLTREELGHETIDTFRLKKYLVTVKYGDAEDKYYEWYRSDFPIPVKTESLNGHMSYEYRRIKFTQQNPSLFNQPSRSYKKVTTEELIELEKMWAEEAEKRKKRR